MVSHRGGCDFEMHRFDARAARQSEARIDEKVKSQSASPGTEIALHRLVDDLISGHPGYDEMSPALADAVRDQLPRLQATLGRLGAIRSIRFLGVGSKGEDVYTVSQENGSSHWRIALDLNGSISTAIMSPGP